MNFQELKQTILQRAISADACNSEKTKAENATNLHELLLVVKANIGFIYNHKILSADELLFFGDELLLENGIYVKKSNISISSQSVILYNSSTVRAYDSSTVEAYDRSTVRAYNSSTVQAYGSSTVQAYDRSTVQAYDSSTVEAYGSSTVRAYNSSTVQAYGSSTVQAYDSSTVQAYDSSTILKGHGTATIESDNAIIRCLYENKIYVKKGTFEIIEL